MTRNTLLLAACFTLGGGILAAKAQEFDGADSMNRSANVSAQGDPWQPVNRRLYGASSIVDRYLFRPLAMTYRRILPRPVRNAAHNFVSNLDEPSVAVNDLLQGKFKRAGTTSVRFVANTTIGVAGLFDVAGKAGLLKHENDFGITLGKWRLKAGPYIYVPLAGPSSVRDLTGVGVDFFLDPLGLIKFRDSDVLFAGGAVVGPLDARARVDKTLKDLKIMAVDPYATMRSAYLQSREDKVRDGKIDVNALPEFPDDPEPVPAAPIESASAVTAPSTASVTAQVPATK